MVGGHIVQFFADMPDTVVPIIGTVRNWQWVFIIVGAPGILFAFVVLLIREPVRRSMQAKTNSASQVESVIPFKDVLAYMRQNRGTFICHFFGFAIYGFVATGIGFWLPSFFERTYGLPAAAAGIRRGYVTIFLKGGGVVGGCVPTVAVR